MQNLQIYTVIFPSFYNIYDQILQFTNFKMFLVAFRSSGLDRNCYYKFFRLPLPPGVASTLWKSDERFLESYFQKYPVSLPSQIFVGKYTDQIQHQFFLRATGRFSFV